MPREIKCPTCRKETAWEDNPYRPFCSDRCRVIDLGSWAQERYRISGEEREIPSDDDEDEEARKRQ
jgi:endogenous inhibitor of DNA gyrase (YacG/DUF329 family)